MTDPYLILGVTADAGDAAIEAAYLEGIKRYPPERSPAQFEALRGAFEKIRPRRDRLSYELFDPTPPTGDDLLNKATPVGPRHRPDRSLIDALLRGER